ncbi:MAG TPA: Hsp20/alpha crystallin family protein [Spirochaetota bacterium]|jgi:HSP20 family protein|nr:Hsp20/alpha crystallin family protein [Spirochaetota bacterium]OPZ37136.1 MAG: Spore protein SP21 [Spirochaetes bacterium ADurb.BinA120]HNU92393.1 Hsp20/alpha crystallin family protein [Spirochaetota bacterium]HPI14903.1 Hsp20/alpha crystallin family protein [Spirochaetota bacterium]HPO46016.1 Hsp20/alpha crystallin family protein [Spirochaetota bacterium]
MYTTYDVFDEMVNLRDLVDRFFTEAPALRRNVEYPYVNLRENNDEVVVTAVLPGVKADSLEILLEDASLLLEGEKKSDVQDKPYIRKERAFGKFKKAVKLPYRVDGDKIEAGLKDGILTVKLAKAEEARPKKIEIR